MCGIAGIFNLDGRPVNLQAIKRMTDVIGHRGPDGEGHFVKDNIGIGHKRLSILDLSERGRQPMSSGNGNWIISFNGCIYNFPELKKELQNLGRAFRSATDTEVIAEGFSEFGIDFISRLNGMFAIAAWSAEEKALYLCRDRYGVKPLYYHFNGKTLVFASEIKAILTHPAYQLKLNYQALNEYFTFQNLFTYQTLFEGIVLLPQANTVRIDHESSFVRHHSWWDYDFSRPDDKMSFQEATDETKRLFRQAVKRQMISDVPVGSYLSGGMDSGSITAIASQNVDRLSTFTCGFDMSEVTGVEANYDERRSAELMANHFKTEQYEQIMNAGDIRWSLPRVVWHLEDLRLGMSYPNYYISRLASKFVKVCLTGAGGDELYGGYPWRYYRVFDSLGKQDFFNQYYDYWQRLVKENDREHGLFTQNVLAEIEVDKPRHIFERVFTFNDKLKYDTPEQHIQNSLYFEIKTFLPGVLLVGDKLSMANSLEERFPFLDNDLVDFAQRIPVRHKLSNLKKEIRRIDENTPQKKKAYREFSDGKNVLRKAMQDFIPETIVNRKKQGFSAPDESWYRGESASYVKETLLNPYTASSEFIRKEYIKNIIDEHMDQKKNHRLLIWSMLCFEWWVKIFLLNESFDK